MKQGYIKPLLRSIRGLIEPHDGDGGPTTELHTGYGYGGYATTRPLTSADPSRPSSAYAPFAAAAAAAAGTATSRMPPSPPDQSGQMYNDARSRRRDALRRPVPVIVAETVPLTQKLHAAPTQIEFMLMQVRGCPCVAPHPPPSFVELALPTPLRIGPDAQRLCRSVASHCGQQEAGGSDAIHGAATL